MAREDRYLTGAVAVALFALPGAASSCSPARSHTLRRAVGLNADGIVVLTGGEHRLSEAAGS